MHTTRDCVIFKAFIRSPVNFSGWRWFNGSTNTYQVFSRKVPRPWHWLVGFRVTSHTLNKHFGSNLKCCIIPSLRLPQKNTEYNFLEGNLLAGLHPCRRDKVLTNLRQRRKGIVGYGVDAFKLRIKYNSYFFKANAKVINSFAGIKMVTRHFLWFDLKRVMALFILIFFWRILFDGFWNTLMSYNVMKFRMVMNIFHVVIPFSFKALYFV